jgi:hypothetical protein
MTRISICLCLCALFLSQQLVSGIGKQQPGSTSPQVATLVVGWNDEFNALNWDPRPRPNKPDISTRHRGLLGLTMGSDAPVDPRLPFNWATVSRVADVDIERYPILAVRAVNLKHPGWWDVSVQGCVKGNGDPTLGKEVKTPSLDHDGIILFDLHAQVKNGLDAGTNRLLVRLNIAGPKKGAHVEYDWIRFIRREDTERLRSNPNITELIVEP